MSEKPWNVYMLRCADNTLYTGVTNDLERRVRDHNEGKLGAKYTRSRLPVKLVWSEHCGDKSAAMRRERGIKKLSKIQKEQLCR